MAMFKIYALDEHTKSLPTVDTASGGVATFDTDLTENLVEVKCQIVAKQEGSGTPSPDNERPIQTYTEMNVSACGKNLLDTTIRMRNITSERQVLQNYPMKQGTYCFSFKGVNSGSVVGYFNIESQYEANVRINIPVGADDRLSGTITLTRDQNIGILCNGEAVGYNYKVSDIQIERGSQPTEFVANGTTKRISFDQTVAGGVINVTTGKLRVTHGILTLDGTENITLVGSGTNRRFNCGSYPQCSSMLYSSHFIEASSNSQPWGYYRLVTNYLLLMDNNTQMADATALKTWLANQYSGGTPVQFVYELATPIEIQLDSTTLQALLNENNIWCDTGDTEVKYLLSVGKKIA